MIPPMRRAALLALVLAAGPGCRGTAPELYGEAALGYSAVLVRGRLVLPEGESRDGMMWLNLESSGERYRMKEIGRAHV